MKPTKLKVPLARVARKRLLTTGLILLPLAAQAAPVTVFTASNQTISINGTATTSTVNYAVGNTFNHDTLAISNGGSLSLPTAGGTTGYIYVGQVAGDNFNVITVDGIGSSLSTAGGELKFGYRGNNNTLTISNGGTMTGGSWGNTLGGFGGGGSNAITVTGTGSTWTTQSNSISTRRDPTASRCSPGAQSPTVQPANCILAMPPARTPSRSAARARSLLNKDSSLLAIPTAYITTTRCSSARVAR